MPGHATGVDDPWRTSAHDPRGGLCPTAGRSSRSGSPNGHERDRRRPPEADPSPAVYPRVSLSLGPDRPSASLGSATASCRCRDNRQGARPRRCHRRHDGGARCVPRPRSASGSRSRPRGAGRRRTIRRRRLLSSRSTSASWRRSSAWPTAHDVRLTDARLLPGAHAAGPGPSSTGRGTLRLVRAVTPWSAAGAQRVDVAASSVHRGPGDREQVARVGARRRTGDGTPGLRDDQRRPRRDVPRRCSPCS